LFPVSLRDKSADRVSQLIDLLASDQFRVAMNVVFAIGCKRYRDPHVAQLKYADEDARRFVEAALHTQDPDNTEDYLLHDEHENEYFWPTRANILYFLAQGSNRDMSTELDFLFFYFSGHGWSSQDGTDYLLTSDSLVSMPEYTAVSVPMLEGELRSWEANHGVLFIDACRTVMVGGKSVTIEEDSRIHVDSLYPSGMVTFCSCEPGQTSHESGEIRSGVFTGGVCRALSDEGRCSTIEKLDKYLNNKVPRISRTYGLPPQRPYSRVEPLAVQSAIIVSQRTLEGWQVREAEKPEQIPSKTTAVIVPDVSGQTLYRAISMLDDRGLKLGVYSGEGTAGSFCPRSRRRRTVSSPSTALTCSVALARSKIGMFE
jgi:uncharacterized caspase-like protein